MKSKIGITIIILSFLVSLNIYILIFAAPVFLIGCLILWFSKTSTKKKVLFTIVPLILWYPSFLGAIYLNSYLGPKFAQKVEFRMPSEFRGQVTIVFPVECGQEVRKENKREVIVVPENGIVYYQGVMESGYKNWNYKIQKESALTEIFEFERWKMDEEEMKEVRNDSLGVFGGGGWSTSSLSSKPQISYKVRTFVVDEWKGKEYSHYDDDRDSPQSIYEKEIRKCKKSIHQDM